MDYFKSDKNDYNSRIDNPIEIIEQVNQDIEVPVKIKIVGVGGSGCNTIDRMVLGGVENVDLIAINTDLQTLQKSKTNNTIQIGKSLTKGQGSGSIPEKGQKAAEESDNEIRNAIQSADMVFVTCGMGGGTGTGAAPIVAKIAKESGALTVGVVTKPFSWERRNEVAEEGMEKLQEEVDSLIIISNDNLVCYAEDTSADWNGDLFNLADSVLLQGIKGIMDLILKAGQINVDFADVKTIMEKGKNKKTIMSSVVVKKQSPIEEIIKKITENRLIDGGGKIDKPEGILVNISYKGIPSSEFLKFITQLNTNLSIGVPSSNYITGITTDETLEEDEVKILLIAICHSNSTQINEKSNEFTSQERFNSNNLENIEEKDSVDFEDIFQDIENDHITNPQENKGAKIHVFSAKTEDQVKVIDSPLEVKYDDYNDLDVPAITRKRRNLNKRDR